MAKILTMWIDTICSGPVAKALTGAEVIDRNPDKIDSLMEDVIEPHPPLIVCGPPPGTIPLLEVAQSLSLTYPASPIFYVTSNKDGFFRADMMKNGFADAYLIPFESKEMINRLSDILAKAAATKAESYRSVKLVDFQGSEPLEFDTYIYMPLRGKHIRYTHAGKELAPEQVERLKNHEVTSLQIKQADMPKFYQFTAMQLMMLGKNDSMSATERQEKLQNSVRAVVSDIFSQTEESAGFDSGRKIIGDCQEIVKSYISAQNNNQGSLYDKIAAIAQDGDGTYSQSTNIATFSALFAIGLGLNNAEEIAMAGLLCDVGLAELPPEVQAKEASERTPAEEALYRQHPELSIKLLKSKRIIVPEKVFTYIKQHHENYDGTGFPAKLAGDRISIEAQILGLAVDFTDHLTLKKGQKRMTPKEAMEHLVSTQSGRRFGTSLMSRINRLLFGDTSKKAAA